jgi:O-antigen/teichoic acid export membrane protein
MNNNDKSQLTAKNSESRKFTKDVIWISIAQLFISIILGIVTLPALTKSYPVEVYGTWVQITTTIDLISPILSLQLGLSAVRFLAGEKDKLNRRLALGTMFIAIIIFGCILSILGFILSKQISVMLFANPNYVRYVKLTIVWTFINALYNFSLSYLRSQEKIQFISIIFIVITIMKMIIIVGFSTAHLPIENIVFAMIILQTIFFIYLLITIIRNTGFPLPNFNLLKTYLAFSIPQTPNVILLWTMQLSDRYFITHFMGLTQNGIYTSSNTLAGLTSIFYTPINFALFPLISRLWEEQRINDVKIYVNNSIRLFLTLAIPGAVGISMLSQPLLKLLTTSEFLVGNNIVLLVAFGALFAGLYNINSSLILLNKKAGRLPLVIVIGSIFSVILNIILIPRIGILGAAISNFGSYFAIAIITLFWVTKIVRFDFNPTYFTKVIVATLVMFGGFYIIKLDGILGIVVSIIIGVLVYLGVLILLRAFSERDIQFIKNTMKNALVIFEK